MSEKQGHSVKGLPMFAEASPEALAKDKAQLAELEKLPTLEKWKGYWARTGPGWFQSAMTLGGGTAFASLFAGAFLGYKLLWLQPVSMFLGIIMLSAMSHQSLSVGEKPFSAISRHIHPSIAWAWALGALIANIIWHFPQYALCSAMIADIISAITRWDPGATAHGILLLVIGICILFVATWISWNYAKGKKGIKLVERIIKWNIWIIIFCFAAVVIRQSFAGEVAWGKVFLGFIPFSYIPREHVGVSIMIAGFSAAVGINMTFLFGYSYLAKGWGKEHRGIAKFDLVTGMWIPYTLATGLMIIAAACTIHGSAEFDGTKISPIQAASMLQGAGIPLFLSRVIFGLGIAGMTFNAINMQMLTSGFAACEMFNVEPGGWKYKLACMIPAPGFLGVVLWKYMGSWIAIPTSAICGLMLPIAYISFFLLNNKKEYLGKDMPKGGLRFWWNLGMLTAIGISIVSVVYYLYNIFGK
ncbi:MAG: hypothetical protein GF401_12345 [Chitinivibrionales bacterium]|nr:hypothetical protein [Chitinivibrionales bacterium]